MLYDVKYNCLYKVSKYIKSIVVACFVGIAGFEPASSPAPKAGGVT